MLDVLERLSRQQRPYIEVGIPLEVSRLYLGFAHLKSCYVFRRSCQSLAGHHVDQILARSVGPATEKPRAVETGPSIKPEETGACSN